jgi:hypothetical protein
MLLEENWGHVADVIAAFRNYPKTLEFRHETWDAPWILAAKRAPNGMGRHQ